MGTLSKSKQQKTSKNKKGKISEGQFFWL